MSEINANLTSISKNPDEVNPRIEEKFPKEVKLLDGSKLIVKPLTEDDIEQSFRFFQDLPEDVRLYMPEDVTKEDVVRRRIKQDDLYQYHRLAVFDKDKIVADGVIKRETFNWKRHLGEIQVVIHPDYQRKGLGTILIHELYSMANLLGIKMLYTQILEEQQGALQIFSKLGFKKELVKKGHIKDLYSQKHDLNVMTCNLEETLKKDEGYQQKDEIFPIKKYPKEIELANGEKIVVRPMTDDDFIKSFNFFKELPEEDRFYLKVDVSKEDVVKRRMKQDDLRQHHRLVAINKNKIIADATIYMEVYNWKKHLGEIRVIIHPDYQRKGLGTMLIHELYVLANLLGIQILYVHILEVQQGALNIFSKLGFKQEIIKRSHVKDLHSQKHDLIIMSCNLAELWEQWEMLMLEMDTGRG